MSKKDDHGSGMPFLKLIEITFQTNCDVITIDYSKEISSAKGTENEQCIETNQRYRLPFLSRLQGVGCHGLLPVILVEKNHSPLTLMCTISRTRSICQNKCHSKMACQVQGGEEM